MRSNRIAATPSFDVKSWLDTYTGGLLTDIYGGDTNVSNTTSTPPINWTPIITFATVAVAAVTIIYFATKKRKRK